MRTDQRRSFWFLNISVCVRGAEINVILCLRESINFIVDTQIRQRSTFQCQLQIFMTELFTYLRLADPKEHWKRCPICLVHINFAFLFAKVLKNTVKLFIYKWLIKLYCSSWLPFTLQTLHYFVIEKYVGMPGLYHSPKQTMQLRIIYC